MLLLRAMNISVSSDATALGRVAAEQFVELAQAAILARGRFTVALSGGGTPRRMYESLSEPSLRHRVDWSRVEVFWGDERGVPPDHPDSNFRMASEALLDRVPIPRQRIHRIRAEIADRAAAARDYQTEIARAFEVNEAGPPPSFDLALLGMVRHSHVELLDRAWELRDNLTAYDAVYVALAEALDAVLVTCDGPLGGSPGHSARIEVIR